jgi:hypothetical protein
MYEQFELLKSADRLANSVYKGQGYIFHKCDEVQKLNH